MFIFSAEFGIVAFMNTSKCNFRMRRVSYKGNESREREKREGVSIGDLNHNLTC